MVRAFIAAMIAAACFVVPAFADAPVAIQKIWTQTAAPTAKLSNSCSAQIIYSERDQKTGKVETLVLTARHCVENDPDNLTKTIDITTYDDKLSPTVVTSYLGDVIGKAANGDVALIRLRDRNTWFENVVRLERADTKLYFGEDIIAVGYPKAMALTLTRGTLGPIERITVTGTEHNYFRSTTDIAPGSSGGGLYHLDPDGNWRLIGIATAVIPSTSFMTFFTTIDDIEAYLKMAAPQVFKSPRY